MPSNKHNTPSELDPELKEMYEMTDIEFQTMILRNLNELQENTDRLKR